MVCVKFTRYWRTPMTDNIIMSIVVKVVTS